MQVKLDGEVKEEDRRMEMITIPGVSILMKGENLMKIDLKVVWVNQSHLLLTHITIILKLMIWTHLTEALHFKHNLIITRKRSSIHS